MKRIEIHFHPNIVVAGGGTAGCAAAVAAARRGHKVLLIEEGNCLGGVSTSGGSALDVHRRAARWLSQTAAAILFRAILSPTPVTLTCKTPVLLRVPP